MRGVSQVINVKKKKRQLWTVGQEMLSHSSKEGDHTAAQ
jgi:hypothetical protein